MLQDMCRVIGCVLWVLCLGTDGKGGLPCYGGSRAQDALWRTENGGIVYDGKGVSRQVRSQPLASYLAGHVGPSQRTMESRNAAKEAGREQISDDLDYINSPRRH